ncbi:hypothetical protein [Actinoplanes sp. URMC 104]|uniref:hypothetical protein n=1 Tax=Actinoplanes sp. URMC 104 TaxID=3423409 RepID=UPI003F1D27AF
MTEQAPAKMLSGIDIPKTIAGTLAAVSAAVVGSFLGVAGTLVGAAVASIVGSVGTELYQRWINRGSEKIKSTFVTAPAAVGTPPVVAAEHEVPSEEPPVASPRREVRWGRIAAVAGALFVLAMGTLTAFELVSGRSMADAVGHRTSSSTTLGSAIRGDNGTDEKATPSESASTEPSAEPSDDPTGTPSPSAEPSETATEESPEPQQTGGTDSGTTPTQAPTGDPAQQDGTDGTDQQDGDTQQDGTQQDGTQQDGVEQQQITPGGE